VPAKARPVLTIGHSNRPLDEFLAMVKAHGVQLLIDVRIAPHSRYNPQFNKEALPDALASVGVDYLHMAGLGGHRHPLKESINTGWKNVSFRGYADYMQTAEFEQNVAELLRLAKDRLTAIMCAESVPWRCHRSLIADALTARGIEVQHIMTVDRADPHKLTPFARVEFAKVTYPPEGLELFPR